MRSTGCGMPRKFSHQAYHLKNGYQYGARTVVNYVWGNWTDLASIRGGYKLVMPHTPTIIKTVASVVRSNPKSPRTKHAKIYCDVKL